MVPNIKFGTSGWRGLIARDFTFDNVRLATQGIAVYLNSEMANPASPIHGRKPVVILGYDTRFLGREFALAVGEVLAAGGLVPVLCNRDTPTPVIAHTIRACKAVGGINLTASHNPAEYQGLKFSTYNGAPATPDVTKQIEAAIARLIVQNWSFSPDASIRSADVAKAKAAQFGAELVNLAGLNLAACVISLIRANVAKKYRAVPISKHGNTITLVVSDPSNLDTIDNLHRLLKTDLELKVASEQDIETALKKYYGGQSAGEGSFTCKTIDPMPDYFKQLRKLIDFAVIKKARLKVAVELMYGTGHGYLDTLLAGAGAKITIFHNELNPLFGGHHPEPNAEGMHEVSKFVRSGKAQIGLGLDGDADRFGIVDKDGTWLTPNQILALALYHLKKNRHWTGAVVRTVPTSHQVDAVAQMLDVKVHETPVGFKYIGALMESEPIIVGGEESGGLSVKGHVPEKDGILACLLMAELVATEKKSLGQILKVIEKQTGEFHTDRINVAIPAEKKAALLAKLGGGLEAIGPFKVQKFITTDGYKFLLPNGEWVAFRASGTEPLIRCYIEAKTAAQMKKLRAACQKLLAG